MGVADIKRLVIGRPLKNSEASHQKWSVMIGSAAVGPDLLSSTAFSFHEMLAVLALAGAAAMLWGLAIAAIVFVIVVILTVSYSQVIKVYHSDGGGFIVTKDNLGHLFGSLAFALLLFEYVMNAAVTTPAGVNEIASALRTVNPDISAAIFANKVLICLGIQALLWVVQMRGASDSGKFIVGFVYLFVITSVLTVIVGLVKMALGGLPPSPEVLQPAVTSLSLFLFLRAAAAAFTALTGVEANSNAARQFKEPSSLNARKSLWFLSGIVVILFTGFTILALRIHAVPLEDHTSLSQIAMAVWGPGLGFWATMIAALMILALASFTSYVDFPRVAASGSRDLVPAFFGDLGDRLVYHWGITTVAIAAGALIIVFQGDVSALLPLFGVSIFIEFTLCQFGMVIFWRKVGKLTPGKTLRTTYLSDEVEFDPQWKRQMAINLAGAVMTFIVGIVFLLSKFVEGAWIVVFVVGLMMIFFHLINRHYRCVAEKLSLAGMTPPKVWYEKPTEPRCLILLPVSGMHKATLIALQEAKQLARQSERAEIRAVYADAGIEPERRKLQAKWNNWSGGVPLEIIESPERDVTNDILDEIETAAHQSICEVVVILPYFETGDPLQGFFHNQTAQKLTRGLQKRALNARIEMLPYSLVNGSNGNGHH